MLFLTSEVEMANEDDFEDLFNNNFPVRRVQRQTRPPLEPETEGSEGPNLVQNPINHVVNRDRVPRNTNSRTDNNRDMLSKKILIPSALLILIIATSPVFSSCWLLGYDDCQ